ncbi:MAG: hypothetical protein ACHQ3P_03160 [Candidatus Limnocylindrales bacterium]
MDRPEDEFPVERIRGGGLGTTMITASIIVVALLAAVVKPWGGPAPGPTTSPIAVAAAPTPATAAPSASLSPFDGPFGLVCYGGLEWRLVMREINGVATVRTWYDMATVAADGPSDASIPFLRVHSEGVLSLGYCTNSDTSDLLSVASTTVWKVTPGRLPEPIGPMRLSADSPVDPDVGSLFAPPRAPDGSSATWTPGRYVFEVSYQGPFAQPAWFGVDIIAVHPLDDPSETPSVAPDAPPSTPPANGAGPLLAPAPAHVSHALLW